MDQFDDLLGPESLDDLLGPLPKKRRPLRKLVGKRDWGTKEPYRALERPDDPVEGAIWDARAEAHKEGILGVKCLIKECRKKLKPSKGRPRILCGDRGCFREYRRLYRRDYDHARPENARGV